MLERLLAQLQNDSIEEVDVSLRKLSESTEYAVLALALSRNSSARRVNMSSCGLDDRVADKLGTMLAVNTHIEFLDLSNNSISDVGAWPLAMGLACNPSVSQVDLRRNRFGSEGKALLAAYGPKVVL